MHTKVHSIYQPWIHEQGTYLKTKQTLDTRTRANTYKRFMGSETGLTWPMQFHIIINSGLVQGWFFSPSNSLRSCTLLWWIFCTITDYCHGNRCITWQLRYLRDKKQLLKETGILQERGYLFPFLLLASYCFRSSYLLSHGCSFHKLVKNVSVHHPEFIFSHVIFFSLIKKCSIYSKEKK